MCAIITALMFMAALFSVYASEDKATAIPISAAKSPDGDSESPYQHLSIKEFVAAISKYDETNYLDLQVIVAREANSDRRYFIYKELYRIFQTTSSVQVKSGIASIFFNQYIVDNGSLALPNYLVELAAFLPKQDREKAVEVLTNTGKETYLHSKFIGLVAALNIHEAKQYLKKELEGHTPSYRKNDPIYDADRYWRIRIALAQMGEREYIDHCIEALNYIYQTDEDRFVRSRFLYYVKDIRIIRQPDTISIIISYSNDESESMAWVGSLSVVANVAIGALRDSLYGFPIDDSAYPFTPEQRQVAREWLKNTYHPRLIKSHSVLIDGKLYDNIADWQKGLIKIVDGKVVILDEPEGAAPTASPETAHPVPAGDQGQ